MGVAGAARTSSGGEWSIVVKLYLSALALSAGVVMAQDPTALVTFYSAGGQPCGKAPAVIATAGSAEIPYQGPIYDGAEKLVKRIAADRVVTLRMKPGPHSFAGQNINGPKTKRGDDAGDLRLTLMPNQHYYIRLTLKEGVYSIRHYDFESGIRAEVYGVRHFFTTLTETSCEAGPRLKG
jgi:hypothetical protein